MNISHSERCFIDKGLWIPAQDVPMEHQKVHQAEGDG